MKAWDETEPLARCVALRETRQANASLQDYAAMGAAGGQRSLRALAALYIDRYQKADGIQTPKPPTNSWGTLTGWSVKFQWVARCEDWDALQRASLIKEQQKQQADMLRKHSQIAAQLQLAALARLKQIQEDLALLTAADVRRYIQLSITVERMSIGLPSEILNVTSMSDDEILSKYRDLLARIGNIGSGNEAEGLDPS